MFFQKTYVITHFVFELFFHVEGVFYLTSPVFRGRQVVLAIPSANLPTSTSTSTSTSSVDTVDTTSINRVSTHKAAHLLGLVLCKGTPIPLTRRNVMSL